MDRSPSTSSSTSNRSSSPYDRHIRRLDNERFNHPSPSSSGRHSNSSYHQQLEQTLLSKKTLRQYTRARKEKAECFKSPPPRRKCEPLRNFRISKWEDKKQTNLLDWSHSNFICAGYEGQLSFYNMNLHDSLEEATPRRYYISRSQILCSIKFAPTNTKIAAAYTNGMLQIYDYYTERSILHRNAHKQRIGALDWKNKLIFTGSKDKCIKATDCRSPHAGPAIAQGHSGEVCGVRSNGNLLASGGKDKQVLIYDLRKAEEVLNSYMHSGSVKALAWMGSTLVSGGRQLDDSIIFWKDTVEEGRQIHTGSATCGLIASSTSPELISCHGFSLNQIIIWSKEGKRVHAIHAHQKPVIYSALSPCGQYLATGGGDQILKVWRMFQKRSERQWAGSVLH